MSLDDIVSAVKLDDGEIFEFKEKLSESGHSTYRIIPLCAQGDPALERAVSELNELGAFYEEGPSRLLAFDIPPEANIHAIYQLMEEYAEAGLWDFKEGHFSCLN